MGRLGFSVSNMPFLSKQMAREGNAQVSLAKSLGQCMATMHSRTPMGQISSDVTGRSSGEMT